MSRYPTPYEIELLEEKYPGWRERYHSAFWKIGENNDIESLRMMEMILGDTVPYNAVAIGAATAGQLDMLSYSIHHGNLVSTMGYRLYTTAKKYGHDHLIELIHLHFGDKIYDLPD